MQLTSTELREKNIHPSIFYNHFSSTQGLRWGCSLFQLDSGPVACSTRAKKRETSNHLQLHNASANSTLKDQAQNYFISLCCEATLSPQQMIQ